MLLLENVPLEMNIFSPLIDFFCLNNGIARKTVSMINFCLKLYVDYVEKQL